MLWSAIHLVGCVPLTIGEKQRPTTVTAWSGELSLELLAYSLAAEWPQRVLSETNGENIVLSRAGRGDRVAGIWIQGASPPVLMVGAQGAEARELMREGRSVLAIDVFQPKRDQTVRHFLTFNKTDDANRVQDILTALAYLNVPNVRLVGRGKAAVWCLFAAALAAQPVELRADLAGFSGSDQNFIDSFFVPGIQRAGGLRAARLAAGVP